MDLNTVNNLLWIVAAAETVGAIANIMKKWWCFVIWIITSILWAAYSFYTEVWAQAFVWTLYVGITYWGLMKWRKEISLKVVPGPVVQAEGKGEKNEAHP